MAITSIKTGSSFTNLVKYNDFLGPNSAYIPSSYESIASATGTGSSNVITFSSIPSTYASLQIRGLWVTQGWGVFIRFNSDSGSNYAFHRLTGNGSSASADGFASQTYIDLDPGGLTGTEQSVGIIDIHNYASTTQNKTVRQFTGLDRNTTNGRVKLVSGLWMNTSAITSISFTADNSQAFSTTTQFALYGIKGA